MVGQKADFSRAKTILGSENLKAFGGADALDPDPALRRALGEPVDGAPAEGQAAQHVGRQTRGRDRRQRGTWGLQTKNGARCN